MNSDCLDVLGLLVDCATVVITAAAAFMGAYFTHWYSSGKQAKDDRQKYYCLIVAFASAVKVQLNSVHSLLTQLKGTQEDLKADDALTKPDRKIRLANFNAQAEGILDIRRALLPFRTNTYCFARVLEFEGLTKNILHWVEQYNIAVNQISSCQDPKIIQVLGLELKTNLDQFVEILEKHCVKGNEILEEAGDAAKAMEDVGDSPV